MIMSSFSLEIIDGVSGGPAEGIRVTVWRSVDAVWSEMVTSRTDTAGRLVDRNPLPRGRYRVALNLDQYYPPLGMTSCVGQVEVVFRLLDDEEQVRVTIVVTPASVVVCRRAVNAITTERGPLLDDGQATPPPAPPSHAPAVSPAGW
jgi:5-hydroxyisourate hydrolase